MSIFISRPDLWEKLIERRNENKDLEVGFHINMGINQAIGIMNRMPAYELLLARTAVNKPKWASC